MNEYLSELIRKCYIYRCTSRVQPSDSRDDIDVISHHQTTHILTLQRRTSLMQSIRAVRPLTHNKKTYVSRDFSSFEATAPASFLPCLAVVLRTGWNGIGWCGMLRENTLMYVRCQCQVYYHHCIAPSPPCENTERRLGRDGELEWNG